jgi:hypothetical protein
VVLPVTSANHPTTVGPIQPEKEPSELVSAIPPAAAVPASSIGGTCQNTTEAVSVPATATTSAPVPAIFADYHGALIL